MVKVADRRDVIEVLTHDHREVEDMFRELTAAVDPAERRRIVDDVTIELVRHSVAEEMHLYPAVRWHVPGGDAMADSEIDDHGRVERLLKDLEKTDAGHAEFPALVRHLVQEVSAHIQDEETNLLPALASHATRDELLELGEKVQAAKRTAPTRPHPMAPDTPPLNKLLAPGTGLVDRVRDHLTGRGGH
ncbi:hemerythrin domain-containing protein [Spirillospora albida]|uniref:hemerythrin domain-containing protein n=1 Tax=Spirillospora albida TaxID=58123 RepID=UPI0004C09234|nr:hemerythrin domain-containing protein [Spirillospora albida]